MAEQTSVRYLVSKLFGDDFIVTMSDEELNILQEADELHKEEVKTAFNHGMNCSSDYFIVHGKDAEDENYYNETFKSK